MLGCSDAGVQQFWGAAMLGVQQCWDAVMLGCRDAGMRAMSGCSNAGGAVMLGCGGCRGAGDAGCCLCSKLFGKKLDPHEEAMQILKEQLSAAQAPAAAVGMQPPTPRPLGWAGGAPGPRHSPLSASQGPKETVAAVKPVTSGRYQLRAPTGHPAATRTPGIAGQSRGTGGVRGEWGTSPSPAAPGDGDHDPHGITAVPG